MSNSNEIPNVEPKVVHSHKLLDQPSYVDLTIEFWSDGDLSLVQDRGLDGTVRFNLSPTQVTALVAYWQQFGGTFLECAICHQRTLRLPWGRAIEGGRVPAHRACVLNLPTVEKICRGLQSYALFD